MKPIAHRLPLGRRGLEKRRGKRLGYFLEEGRRERGELLVLSRGEVTCIITLKKVRKGPRI